MLNYTKIGLLTHCPNGFNTLIPYKKFCKVSHSNMKGVYLSWLSKSTLTFHYKGQILNLCSFYFMAKPKNINIFVLNSYIGTSLKNFEKWDILWG